jgi:hypothetical protein
MKEKDVTDEGLTFKEDLPGQYRDYVPGLKNIPPYDEDKEDDEDKHKNAPCW